MVMIGPNPLQVARSPADPGSASIGIVARADQPGLVGQYDGLYPVAELEFGEEPGHVGFDRRLAEGQLRGKFGVAQPSTPSEANQIGRAVPGRSGRSWAVRT